MLEHENCNEIKVYFEVGFDDKIRERISYDNLKNFVNVLIKSDLRKNNESALPKKNLVIIKSNVQAPRGSLLCVVDVSIKIRMDVSSDISAAPFVVVKTLEFTSVISHENNNLCRCFQGQIDSESH